MNMFQSFKRLKPVHIYDDGDFCSCQAERIKTNISITRRFLQMLFPKYILIRILRLFPGVL